MPATPEEIAALRIASGEQGSSTFTDQQLTTIIEQADNNPLLSAAMVWEQKAAMYAGLVDTSESGSSRSMSQLNKNALAMLKSFEDRYRASLPAEQTSPVARSKSRRAVRL